MVASEEGTIGGRGGGGELAVFHHPVVLLLKPCITGHLDGRSTMPISQVSHRGCLCTATWVPHVLCFQCCVDFSVSGLATKKTQVGINMV